MDYHVNCINSHQVFVERTEKCGYGSDEGKKKLKHFGLNKLYMNKVICVGNYQRSNK